MHRDNPKAGNRLRARVLEAVKWLKDMNEKDVSSKEGPDKWSKKEILGHLVDSAYNNHRRFVIAQKKQNLILDPYDQVLWVRLNDYQSRSWDSIVALWKNTNLHLAILLDHLDDSKLDHMVEDHNLDQIAFHVLDKSKPVNLKYLVSDYITHLEHHLNQLSKVQ